MTCRCSADKASSMVIRSSRWSTETDAAGTCGHPRIAPPAARAHAGATGVKRLSLPHLPRPPGFGRLVGHDRVEPRLKRRPRFKAPDSPQRADKGLLHHVFGVGGMTDERVRQRVHIARVPVDQFAKGVRIIPPQAGHKLGVGQRNRNLPRSTRLGDGSVVSHTRKTRRLSGNFPVWGSFVATAQ